MKSEFLKGARRIIFPARCPGCDTIIPAVYKDQIFCTECQNGIIPAEGRICFRCGKPIVSGCEDLCRDCIGKHGALLMGRGAFIYTGPMKMAMYRFKYSGRRAYARGLAQLACDIHGDWLSGLGVDAIVPIPMYKDKMLRRGYNQAEVFARALSGCMSVPVFDDVLVREKNTLPQKGLNREMRQKNLKNAFKIRQSSVKFDCVLLVDDIYTTGSTMDEAAGVISRAFGARVFSFCICMGAD